MTVRGIEYNLAISPYTAEVGSFKFFFSARRYLEKFNAGIAQFTAEETARYKEKWGFTFNFDSPLQHAFEFYKLTEKRGFYIEREGEPLCQNLTISVGEIPTKKS